MKINPYIFRGYDIRGVVGEDIDENVIEAIGKSYGTFLRRRKIKQAVVGHDCRVSGPSLEKAFIKGLTSTGVDVIDIGLIMTQMMYFGQYYFQTMGGAILTASHNPPQFNGFKLAIGFSRTTENDEMLEIRKNVEEDSYFKSDRVGTVVKKDIADAYKQDLLKKIDIKKKIKVVINPRNGTPGKFVPEILRTVGCEVIEVNTKVDGSFPNGTPDPTDELFLKELSADVIKYKADLGFAFDGDGDRVGVVDDKGQMIFNDVLLAIYAMDVLKRFPHSSIVFNTLCTQLLLKVIREYGGNPIIWKTGHAFIKSKVAESKAMFGGELSGHFYFMDNSYGYDDGTFAALRLLEILSENADMKLSEIYEHFPKYISSPEIKIGCPDDVKVKVVREIAERFKMDFKNAEITDETVIPGDDGCRADFEDGMIIFRYSQNGPYVTIKFEAMDEDTYLQRKKYVRRMLESFPEMLWKGKLCVNLSALT